MKQKHIWKQDISLIGKGYRCVGSEIGQVQKLALVLHLQRVLHNVECGVRIMLRRSEP